MHLQLPNYYGMAPQETEDVVILTEASPRKSPIAHLTDNTET